MSPDTRDPDFRIGRLEQDVAGVKQQLTDLVHDVKAVPSLTESLAEVKVAMQYMQRDQGDVKAAMHELEVNIAARVDRLAQTIENREELRSEGDKSRRVQFYAIIAGFAFVFVGMLTQIIITLAGA